MCSLHSQLRRPSRAVTRRGFTLIEMCLGMLVTSMVFGALATFAMALSNLWSYTDNTHRAEIIANQTSLRINDWFQAAKGTGYYVTGTGATPACLVVWANDGDTARAVTPDGKAQKSEVQLLRFNSTNHTLERYVQPTPSGADTDITALLNDASIVSYLSGVTPKIMARNVSNGRIMVTNPRSTTSSPTLYFQYVVASGSDSVLQSGTASIHAPGTLP